VTLRFNWLLVADMQRQDAASRRLLPAGQRQRWASSGGTRAED
jgi:hypothetical protein